MTSQVLTLRASTRWGQNAASALWLALAACQQPAQLPAETAPPAEIISNRPPAGAEAAVAVSDLAVSDDLAVSASPSTLPPQPQDCVTGADAKIDKESSWSKETGARLDRLLPSLTSCTSGLSAEREEITLRLVYGPNGKSTSQHVVRSSPGACAASACLMKGMTQIVSPQLVTDRASYDIALVVKRGNIRRVAGALDALVDDTTADATSCVDPAIAALSRAKIKEVVSTRYPELKSCHSQALVRNHSAAGNVTIEFVIGPAGEVSLAQVREATLPDCIAIQCMLSEFRGLRFPPPVGRSVRIIYPLNYVVEQPPVIPL